MAAGSRFPLSLPLGSPSHIEVEDRRDGNGESYAGTSLPNPWQGFASATLAPLILSRSCCNKSSLFFLLSMVAGRNGGGGSLFLGSEVDLLDPCIPRPADLLFKPSIKFCCWYSLTDAVHVGSCGVAAAVMWSSSISDVCAVSIKMASNLIQAMEPFFPSEALQMCSNLEPSVVLQEFLYTRKGISWPFPCCSAQLGAATQGMCWAYYVRLGLIVIIGKSSHSGQRFIAIAIQCLVLKWDNLVCVNWSNQAEQIFTSSLDISAHTQQSTICGSTIGTLELVDARFQDAFSGSAQFYVGQDNIIVEAWLHHLVMRNYLCCLVTMVVDTALGDEICKSYYGVSEACLLIIHKASRFVGEVNLSKYCLCCIWIKNEFKDVLEESVKAFSFGLFHRQRVRSLLLLVPRFNGRHDLRLSSVKRTKNLQLSVLQPQVQKPIRSLGEPPGYYRRALWLRPLRTAIVVARRSSRPIRHQAPLVVFTHSLLELLLELCPCMLQSHVLATPFVGVPHPVNVL